MTQETTNALQALQALPRLGWCAPTPLQERLMRAPTTGRVCELLIKRDGLLHGPQGEGPQGEGPQGELYGGNKLRKLEFILPPLLKRGVSALCTVGGEGSHHALATVIAARSLGLASHVALTPQPHSEHSRAVYERTKALASSVTLLDEQEPSALFQAMSAWRSAQGVGGEERGAQGVGWLPTGGSSVEGVFGMVEGALELYEQLSAAQRAGLERIYLPTASGSSLAGLLLGLSIAWGATPPLVVGVRVTSSRLVSGRKVRQLYRAAAARLGWSAPPPPFKLDDSQLGGGYGHPGPLNSAVVELSASLGLPVEQSYTAKALGALLTHIQSAPLHQEPAQEPMRGALFWHTLDERAPHELSLA